MLSLVFFSYEYEIEMGWSKFQCEVPLEKMKELRFDRDYIPLGTSFVNNYCTKSTDASIIIVGGIIILAAAGVYFLYRKNKKNES